MKCPHCGADLKRKDLCGNCGRKIEQAPEIEVEYKDFKVSEYLEIRQKEHKTSSGTETGNQEGKQQGIPHGVSRKMPRMDEKTSEKTRRRTPAEGDLGRKMPAPGSPEGKGSSSFAVAIIFLLLAALVGAFYLWRFLAR
jgi:uncharacterized Zn finger protein (UPF0148 family)